MKFDEMLYTIKRIQPTIIIPSGLPFSGKSHLSKKISLSLNLLAVSFDQQWIDLEQKDKNINWQTVTRVCEDLVSGEIKNGKSVIYDSYNSTNTSRKNFVELSCNYLFIYLPVTKETILERTNQAKINKDRHLLSVQKIEEEINIFEPPSEVFISVKIDI
jgi:predicted kinase